MSEGVDLDNGTINIKGEIASVFAYALNLLICGGYSVKGFVPGDYFKAERGKPIKRLPVVCKLYALNTLNIKNKYIEFSFSGNFTVKLS